MANKGRLFLVPHVLDAEAPDSFIPEYTRQQIHHVQHFIMESEKAGRALIKRLQIKTPQNDIHIGLCNEHTNHAAIKTLLKPLSEGFDMGLMSDAGIPCVADPGYEVVLAAHAMAVQVIPLPGSSSLMMALMASGLGGQSFAFHGYLPIEKPLRIKKIKELETAAKKWGQTQIFMEAPYRNNAMIADILSSCSGETMLTLAADISSANEYISTQSISKWKQIGPPDLHKRPCVFLVK